MKKKSFMPYAVLGIVFVLFNVIAFVVPTAKTPTFWVAYAFSVIAFVVEAFVIKAFAGKDDVPKSRFLGFPSLHVGIVYLIVQLIAFAVFMAIPIIPTWIAIIVCALILGISIICMISAKAAVNEIQRIDQKVSAKVFYIRSLQADIETLAVAESNVEIKEALQHLAKSIKFSDPMSNELLADLEKKITEKVDELKISTDKVSIIKELELLIVERNKKCKILK